MNKKILIVSIAFPPDSSVGSLRPGSFAKYLPLYGWTPYTLTRETRYIVKVDQDLQKGMGHYGKVYHTSFIPNPRVGYRSLKKIFLKYRTTGKKESKTFSGASKAQRENIIKRLIFTFLHMPDEYWGWIPFAVPKGIMIIRKEKIPIIYSTAPPWTSHLVGLFLKLATNCFWIADFRDAWSKNPWNNLESLPFISKRLDHILEAIILRKADKIICVTEGIADDFNELYQDIFKNKIIVIPNGYDEEEFAKIQIEERKDYRFTITYSGSIYGGRSPAFFLKAIQELICQKKVSPEDFLIRFVGTYELTNEVPLRQRIVEMGLSNAVMITGWVSRQEALKYIKNSDALLIIEKDARAAPVKFYEYLACEKPILALVPEGVTKNILSKTGSGFVVKPDDVVGIKEAIMCLYKKWKDNKWSKPNRDIVKSYERKALTKEFADLLEHPLSQFT